MSFGDTVNDCQALLDGCEGDSGGLKHALGDAYSLIWANGSNEGWGHHSYDTIYRATDGRVIHASCGGCSCYGTGDWSYETSEQEAMRMVPEDKRP